MTALSDPSLRIGACSCLNRDAMYDESGALERRRHLLNTALILAGCSAFRALQEITFAYTTRPISWRYAVEWTLPSWLFLVPVGAVAIALASRYPFDRRTWGHSAVVHIPPSPLLRRP